jgi:hypothetical protein
MDSAAKGREVWVESLWQLQQKLAHEDYIGDEPDLYQLRRDLMTLTLLVHELVRRDDGE